MNDPTEQARQVNEYIKRRYGNTRPPGDGGTWYDQGGYIPGGPVPVMIHPDECIITRDLKCVRADHQHEATT